jgi:ferredoxin
MLADRLEIQEAQNEGIQIRNHRAPVRILGEDGVATGVQTLDVIRAFDEQGRFKPELSPGTEQDWPCDSVIISIGQMGELEWVREEDRLEVTARGTLTVDPQTLMTTAEGVFAGGDIAFGPRLIVNAVADGQRAAAGIDSYLRGTPMRKERRGRFTPIPLRSYASTGPLSGYLRRPRQEPDLLPVDRRVGVSVVEVGYDEDRARDQAARCLICSINPVFDSDLCILCNGCVDVCPMDCLKLVPIGQVSAVDDSTEFTRVGAGTEATAMLFDPTRCIRCGLCAARCPTEAVVMNQFQFEERWSTVEAAR